MMDDEVVRAFKRGQRAVKVSMSGPGIDDRCGPVYFTGVGAQGEIIFENEEQLRAYIEDTVAKTGWPIRWVMTIEECVPLDEVARGFADLYGKELEAELREAFGEEHE